MTDAPWHVTPTDPPSMAVLIHEHRELPIRAGAADRVDYVFARLVFSDTAPASGATARGRTEHAVLSRPYRLAVEEPPPGEAGWVLLAEVTVRAGQTAIDAGDIHPPGWHHRHGADNPPKPAPRRTRRHALIFNAITAGLSEAGRFVALTERDAITRRVEDVLDREDGARCPSCDHLSARHQPDGCWHTVTNGKPGRNLVCPCTTPSPAALLTDERSQALPDWERDLLEKQWRRDHPEDT